MTLNEHTRYIYILLSKFLSYLGRIIKVCYLSVNCILKGKVTYLKTHKVVMLDTYCNILRRKMYNT